MLRPIGKATEDAVAAASAIRNDCERVRGQSALTIPEIVSFTNALQNRFEAIKPLMSFEASEVQSTAVELYGSRAPSDVFALIGSAQMKGQALVGVIATQIYNPDTQPAHSFNAETSIYTNRALAGADLKPMHAPLDELILALSEF